MKTKFFTLLSMLALLTISITPAMANGALNAIAALDLSSKSGSSIDLIIRTDGSSEVLAAYIISGGGKVNYQYENVPIIAATIPLHLWSSVAAFSGVVKIEKDPLVQLEIEKNDPRPMFYEIAQGEGQYLTALETSSLSDLPQGYDNFFLTGANLTWEQTNYGEGSIVAVVDTGVHPNVCLENAVIGAPGFPDGYNATGDGIPANSIYNRDHGTAVGSVIASACILTIPNPNNLLYRAINKYIPYGPTIPLLGQAPLAKLYPVKVIPAGPQGVPLSVLLDGLDHVLGLKNSGALDIDVVNLSLGVISLYDGRDAWAYFVTALTQANILVVSAAANSGPTPNTIASPATSDDGIAAGGLDYALASRIAYEYFGLVYMGSPGQGEVMRPTDETRVVNFSSRGPLSDGRMGPDLSAMAVNNFISTPQSTLGWGGGTSFAAPTIAGAAALLNAYQENLGQETNPRQLKNALLAGADPTQVGEAWQSHNDVGFGVLDVPAALDILINAPHTIVPLPQGGNLKANVFGSPVKGKVDTMVSDVITLNPSEKVDFILEVNQYTSKVTIEVLEINTPDNSDHALMWNALEVNLQSAKRSAIYRPIEAYYWLSWMLENKFKITVEDGPWTFAGTLWAYQPMEPGLMKFTLAGDYVNESPVSFKVRIQRQNFRTADKAPFAKGLIFQNDQIVIPVTVPEGAARAQFDLRWLRDWSFFPTSDIDMYIFDPEGNIYFDGISLNAPERQVVEAPMPGVWVVVLIGYELYLPDTYNLYVKIE